jgi:hypothetical protein
VCRLLPELFRLNDAQAGLGVGGGAASRQGAAGAEGGAAGPEDGAAPGAGEDAAAWPDLITRTLVTGGDGYCLHFTVAARRDTRELLAALRRIGENCGPAVPPGVDFTHFDFHF